MKSNYYMVTRKEPGRDRRYRIYKRGLFGDELIVERMSSPFAKHDLKTLRAAERLERKRAKAK